MFALGALLGYKIKSNAKHEGLVDINALILKNMPLKSKTTFLSFSGEFSSNLCQTALPVHGHTHYSFPFRASNQTKKPIKRHFKNNLSGECCRS